jgi:succinoglycan biosynthesis protein ExoV
MQLFYYKRPDGMNNFGDSLNPWLWNQLLPDVFDEDETTAFVGIGTLLNNLLPNRLSNARKVVIFSSGVGYEKGLPNLDNSWTIYCVRGLLSAQKLDLPAKFAVADGAILVRRLFKPAGGKTNRFAFMPHVHHANYGSEFWKLTCEQIGFGYIDPRWPIEQVLSQISQTEVLLAEAMHGAIAADALRVPWIPVRTSSRILSFKWLDWCSSINVKYQPSYIAPLASLYPPAARGIRSSLRATRHWVNCFKQDKFRSLTKIWGNQQKIIATQLVDIAKTAYPTLSNEHRLDQLTFELEERLSKFRADVRDGKYDLSKL